MRLTCNGKEVYLSDDKPLTIDCQSVGTSIHGNGDLYDHGFTHGDLANNDLLIEHGELKVVIQSIATKREQLVASLAQLHDIPLDRARTILAQTGYHFTVASTRITLLKQNSELRKRGIEPNPCGIVELPKDKPGNIFDAFLTGRDYHTAQNAAFAAIYGQKSQAPEGFIQLVIGQEIKAGDQYLSTAGNFQDVPEAVVGCDVIDNGVVYIRRQENPCANVESRGLNWSCACQNGMVGTQHCRVHGSHPEYGVIPEQALAILRGESGGQYCWNYPIFSEKNWEVRAGFTEPRAFPTPSETTHDLGGES